MSHSQGSRMTRLIILRRTSMFVIPLLLLSIANSVSSFGYVDYNDDCEFDVTDYSTFQSRFDQSKFCDTERGLYCVPGLGKCGCYVPHTIYRAGKCRAKIGNSCMAPGNVRLDCVEHARCTNNNTAGATFKCQCIRGYLSNALHTSCFEVTSSYYDRRKYGYRYNNYWNGATAQPPLFAITITFSIVTSVMFCLKLKLFS